MSDGVFTIATLHPDVAELAQGFIERVDGEHLLLPMSEPVDAGAQLQFMVVLADGTAAFMGAGVCADVTDQGDAAPAEQRYEILLAGLQFDERSQPVYDYIVAIRAQAIAIQEQQAGALAGEDEPTEFIDSGAAQPSADVEMEVSDWQSSAAAPSDRPAPIEVVQESAPAPTESRGAQFRTAPPVAVPTGVLRRPAIGVHWQPASPRRPQPSASSGMFRYNGAGLPVPAAPSAPELPRSQWVQPAPRPGDASEAAAAAPSAPPESDPAPAPSEPPIQVQEENPWEA